MPAPPRVVVIGGRGGAAAEQIVRSLPARPGFAAIVAVSGTDALASTLAAATRVPVVEVNSSASLERDHVYVLPHGAHGAAIELGRVAVDGDHGASYAPFDHLL